MPIVTILLVVVLVGVLLWFVEAYVPMSPPIKRLLQGLAVVLLLLWVLQAIGLLSTGVRLR
jgi:hypothetical protein